MKGAGVVADTLFKDFESLAVTSGAQVLPAVVPTVAASATKAAIALAAAAPLSKEEVLECQANWANAIETISKTFLEGGDYLACSRRRSSGPALRLRPLGGALQADESGAIPLPADGG